MNTITVIAQGSPDSLARRVQHDPGIAVAIYQALTAVAKSDAMDMLPKVVASQVKWAIDLADTAKPTPLFKEEGFPP